LQCDASALLNRCTKLASVFSFSGIVVILGVLGASVANPAFFVLNSLML